jgi:hypothetical protein
MATKMLNNIEVVDVTVPDKGIEPEKQNKKVLD